LVGLLSLNLFKEPLLSRPSVRRRDTQNNDTQHDDIQHERFIPTLIRKKHCIHAQCRIVYVMLNAIILSVIMLTLWTRFPGWLGQSLSFSKDPTVWLDGVRPPLN